MEVNQDLTTNYTDRTDRPKTMATKGTKSAEGTNTIYRR